MQTSLVDSPGTFRPMLRLTLPVLLEQMLHTLVGFTDLWLTGNFLPGEAYVAAMTLMIYALWLIGNVFGVVAFGSAAMVARFVGARDMPMANRVMNQSILTGLVWALLLMAVTLPFAANFPLVMGSSRHGGRGGAALSDDRVLRSAGDHGRACGDCVLARSGRHGERACNDGNRERNQHGVQLRTLHGPWATARVGLDWHRAGNSDRALLRGNHFIGPVGGGPRGISLAAECNAALVGWAISGGDLGACY